MISLANLEKSIVGLGIGYENLKVCTQFEGEVLSGHGVRLSRGGYRGHKKQIISNPQPSKKTRVIEPDVQQIPKKPRVDNTIHLLDSVYKNYAVGPPSPESFHAIWSSTDGFWAPEMWIGPIKNLTSTKRSSIKPCVISKLYEDQNHECRLCKTPIFTGIKSNSDVDHIIPLKYGGTCSLGNLQAICVTCHRRKTGLECKKLVTVMGDDDVKWLPGVTYVANSRVHFLVENLKTSNPKDALESFGSKGGVFEVLL